MGLPEILVLVLAVVAVAVAVHMVRRVRLLRRGGVDIALRRRSDPASGRGWRHGVGRYHSDQLRWFWVASLRTGPDVVLERADLEIVDRRRASASEVHTLPATSTVLRCRSAGRTIELAMDGDVLTGFLSWLESTPPGHGAGYRRAS